MTLPARFTFRAYPHRKGDDARGPCWREGHCIRCGRKLVDKVALELDQRVVEYHDFGGVPDDQSQGWFDFGPDCAAALRIRARAALQAEGLPADER